MKKYYLLTATTMYDGFEFTSQCRMNRDEPLTQEDVDKTAIEMFVHTNSGEELVEAGYIIITKEEYNTLEKLGI